MKVAFQVWVPLNGNPPSICGGCRSPHLTAWAINDTRDKARADLISKVERLARGPGPHAQLWASALEHLR